MNYKNHRASGLCPTASTLAASALAALAATTASAQVFNFTYNAATETTLPSAQCWTHSNANEPVRQNGSLFFNASSVGETRFYSSADVTGNDFTQSVVAEMRAQAITGTWQANPCGAGQRAALGFGVNDAQGRVAQVFIGTNRVALITASNPGASGTALTGAHPWVDFDTTGTPRTYRLEIVGLQASLFIDGVQVISVDRRAGSPLGAWPTGSSTPSRAIFGGDLSVCVAGSSTIQSFAVTGTPTGTGSITFTEQPASVQTLCSVQATELRVRATSPWGVTYDWRKNGVSLSNGPLPHGTVISGQGTDTLLIAGNNPADAGSYTCAVTNNCGQRITSASAVSPGVACSPADIAGAGQRPCPDGALTADDIILFVNWFFAGDARADLAGAGQTIGADGFFTADDLIVYVNRFFAGCP
jgi:hypothetical protein